MTIDHVAVYARDLEKLRAFYEAYFGGKSNDGYFNPRTGLRTYFLSFDGGARLEIMHRPGLEPSSGTALREGVAHLSFRLESREAVVLDSDRIGEIINRNPANVVLRFEIIGKPSHAGLAPEDGIHALKAAAKAVNDIPVGNVDDISVMNVSNFISEGKTNVVAAKACFDMEIRSFEEERLQEHIAASEKAVKDACGLYAAQYTMALDRHSDVLYVPEESPLVKGLVKAFESLGIQSRVTRSFGGCDATYLFANGLAVVNIGIGMQAVHSAAENIALKDLETTAEVIRKLIVTNE